MHSVRIVCLTEEPDLTLGLLLKTWLVSIALQDVDVKKISKKKLVFLRGMH